ncbi:MAG: transposase [Agathobaculum desmolans]
MICVKTTAYKCNRHNCYDLSYHLVVVTKYRHPIIQGDLQKRLIKA